MEEIKTTPIVLRKKIKIYVDVSLKDDVVFGMGQRLVSFFGQASIFENTEEIIDYLEEFFEFLSLNFLKFSEEKKFEKDILNESSINEEINKVLFFLPVIIYFYYTDKRTDFFIFPTFKKNYQKNVYKWLLMSNYLKLKERNFAFFKNIFYFDSIKKYFKIFKFLKDSNNTKVLDIINFTTTEFIIIEELFYSIWSEALLMLIYRRNKFLFFKAKNYKLFKESLNLIKKMTCLPINYFLNIVSAKVNYLDEDFEYSVFVEKFNSFISQLYISKKRLFRRLRRRKRFKKKLSRNFEGKKVTYYKIYSYIPNKKKKK